MPRCRAGPVYVTRKKRVTFQSPHGRLKTRACTDENKHEAVAITRSILRIPREIRDEIYRHLLSSEYVEKKEPNPNYTIIPEISTHEEYLPKDFNAPAGTLRCQNPNLRTFHYSPSILSVNHQIHNEALKIWADDNCWIKYSIRAPHYSKQLQAAGFGIIPLPNPDIDINPIATVTATFCPKTLVPSTFIVPLEAHADLPRALWLTSSPSKKDRPLKLAFQSGTPALPAIEEMLHADFTRLRHSCLELIPLTSPSIRGYAIHRKRLNAEHTITSSVMASGFLRDNRDNDSKPLHELASGIKSLMAGLADCQKAPQTHSDILRTGTYQAAAAAMARDLARVYSRGGVWKEAFTWANFAVGVRPIFCNEDMADALLLRAVANAADGRSKRAFRDLKAVEMWEPGNVKVKLVRTNLELSLKARKGRGGVGQ